VELLVLLEKSRVISTEREMSVLVLGLVQEFHMDSYRILWLLNTNLIQEDLHHMDRNIVGNCMLYCDVLFLTLIRGLSVKFAT
jgi:hypothetical protein